MSKGPDESIIVELKSFRSPLSNLSAALAQVEHYLTVGNATSGVLYLAAPEAAEYEKPIEALFPQAEDKGVAIIARLPLASGLLSGKFTKDTKFGLKDHRYFNRDGQQFNVGETFSGIPKG